MKAAGPQQPGIVFVVSEYSQPGRSNQALYAFTVSIDRKKAGLVLPQQTWAFSVDPGSRVVRVLLLRTAGYASGIGYSSAFSTQPGRSEKSRRGGANMSIR